MRRLATPDPWLLLLALLASLGSGCASRYVAETTTIVAGHVDSLQRDYTRYLQRVEDDAAVRIESIALARQRLAQAERGLKRAVADSPHGSLYEGLMTRGTEELESSRAIARRAAEERAALAAAQKKLDREPLKQLRQLSKQLTEMATPANFKQQLGFLTEYFQAVGTEVRALDAKADKAKANAEKTTP